MNKKILFLVLLVTILPISVYAVNDPEAMAEAAKDLAQTIGVAIVVIGWVIAGILYLTAAGSPEKMGTAKKALIAALIGTVLVIIAKLGYEGIKTFLKPVIGE